MKPEEAQAHADAWAAAANRAPTKIGSNVFIGPQAVILMGVTIGDRVKIGAMSFVNKDVPSDCVAFGQPARVKRST